MTARNKGIKRNHALALPVFGFVCAVCLGGFPGAATPPQPQASGSQLPDLVGFTTGMPAQQVYEKLKAIDPGHTVALTQTTIPQLYGDKPIMVGMNPATMDFHTEAINVSFTMPPAPQVAWQIQHQLGLFTSTRRNVYNQLVQKYGEPWPPDRFADPYVLSGLNWYFDEQGHQVSVPAGQALIAFQTCVGQFFGPASYNGDAGAYMANDATTNIVQPNRPRTSVYPLPPAWDPATHQACANIIKLTVTVSATGPPQPDASVQVAMDFKMWDPTIQHRAFVTYNDAVNAVVAKGIQQQNNNANQQAVPKF
jgi:hypothetical protein